MKFLKSHRSNIFFLLVILLLIVPQTRQPIQVGVQRLFAFSPNEVRADKRKELTSYHWELRDLEGNRINFREAEGKISLINIWATWCPPCIAEMPSFAALYQTYGDRVNFYFVSQEEAGKLRSFLSGRNYDLPVFQPMTQPPHNLETTSLPTTYLISKEGKIVIEKVGAADWNSQRVRNLLEELLRE